MATAKPFSTHLLKPDIDKMPKPNGAPHFLVGRRGFYVDKNMFFGRVIVPVKEVPTLPNLPDDADAVLWLDVPRFPLKMLGQAWSFFRWAWDAHHSEAMLDITWDEKHGYRYFVPPQTASAGGVKCIRNPEHYTSNLVGTIHSHCNGSAYHSGTDTHDADSHDGLHMTMGRVSANAPELDIMVSAAGQRWTKLEPERVLAEGDLALVEHPTWWQNYFDHPDAVAKFAGQRFAAGANPTTMGKASPPSWHPRLPGSPGWKKGPWSTWKADEITAFLLEVDKADILTGVDQDTWLETVGYIVESIGELIDDLQQFGIQTNFTYWTDKQRLAKVASSGLPETLPTDQLELDWRIAMGME